MPNVTRGDDLPGLMAYLAGPGRANEHTEPHLVGGDPAVLAWWDDVQLDHAAARAIGRHLDQPHRAFGVDVPGGHVWHVSLSLPAEEGRVPDEKWAAVTAAFMERMHGPSGGDETEGGKAPLRWVAVHHGPSKAGNDHVHIAACLVREDGTKATTWNDRPRSQKVARDLEVKYGLQVLESRNRDRGERGISRPELERQNRLNLPEPERRTLARAVRACATAAADEAEFVRRVRGAGMIAHPRFAAGSGDSVVTGYAVAFRPPGGDQPFWLGGTNLAPDLSLPRLREAWPDSPGHAEAAVAEWTAAKRNRATKPGREAREPTVADWDRYTAEAGALRERLRTVPADDVATWATVAGDIAGVFAAWSRRVEGSTPGPLAAASDALARSAAVRAHVVKGRRPVGPSVRGAAMLLSSIAAGGRGPVAEAVLLRTLANLAKAVHDAHDATGDARRAAEIAQVARRELAAVGAGLPTPETVPQAGVRGLGEMPARPVGSVLPADLERDRVTRPATTRAGTQRGGDDRGR